MMKTACARSSQLRLETSTGQHLEEAARIINGIESQAYSMNTTLEQAYSVVRAAAAAVEATKQRQPWGLAAVVATKISMMVMLFIFIFLWFLLV